MSYYSSCYSNYHNIVVSLIYKDLATENFKVLKFCKPFSSMIATLVHGPPPSLSVHWEQRDWPVRIEIIPIRNSVLT